MSSAARSLSSASQKTGNLSDESVKDETWEQSQVTGGEKMENDKCLYQVTVGDVQSVALDKLDRRLTDEELQVVSNGLNWGLAEGFDVILDTAIDEALKE